MITKDLQDKKSFGQAAPEVTNSQQEVIDALWEVTGVGRRRFGHTSVTGTPSTGASVALVGPAGAGKRYLLGKWRAWLVSRGYVACHLDLTGTSGRRALTYYKLWSALVTQFCYHLFVVRSATAVPPQFLTNGRSVETIQSIFRDLVTRVCAHQPVTITLALSLPPTSSTTTPNQDVLRFVADISAACNQWANLILVTVTDTPAETTITPTEPEPEPSSDNEPEPSPEPEPTDLNRIVHLGLPTIADYKHIARIFADAFDVQITTGAGALAAALAARTRAPPNAIVTLLRHAVLAAAPDSTTLEQHHIRDADGAIACYPVESLKYSLNPRQLSVILAYAVIATHTHTHTRTPHIHKPKPCPIPVPLTKIWGVYLDIQTSRSHNAISYDQFLQTIAELHTRRIIIPTSAPSAPTPSISLKPTLCLPHFIARISSWNPDHILATIELHAHLTQAPLSPIKNLSQNTLKALSNTALAALHALIKIDKITPTQPRATAIYNAYATAAHHIGSVPVNPRIFSRTLHALAHKKIVRISRSGRQIAVAPTCLTSQYFAVSAEFSRRYHLNHAHPTTELSQNRALSLIPPSAPAQRNLLAHIHSISSTSRRCLISKHALIQNYSLCNPPFSTSYAALSKLIATLRQKNNLSTLITNAGNHIDSLIQPLATITPSHSPSPSLTKPLPPRHPHNPHYQRLRHVSPFPSSGPPPTP